MIETISILICILLLVALMQTTSERLYAGTLFALLAGVHHLAFYTTDGIAYYGSAALVDMSVVFFTLRLRNISSAIRSIQDICIASILLNAIGWIMWMLYMPPHAYNAMFIALYSWAIITLLRKDATDDYGDSTVDMGGSNLPRPNDKSLPLDQRVKGAP